LRGLTKREALSLVTGVAGLILLTLFVPRQFAGDDSNCRLIYGGPNNAPTCSGSCGETDPCVAVNTGPNSSETVCIRQSSFLSEVVCGYPAVSRNANNQYELSSIGVCNSSNCKPVGACTAGIRAGTGRVEAICVPTTTMPEVD